ncbi:MAG TPA: prepilin-type N-terminal cleavage/methylation domain-containing protein [Solirubrobacteraceae bacterium]
MRRLIIAAARRARQEEGFTIIEVLTAVVVLGIGLGAVMQLLVVATHATATNRIRQAESNLARELTEDVRSLSYTQLAASSLAATLQPMVSRSTVSGTSLHVQRVISTNGSSNPTAYTFSASFTACSLDDPSDGYGSHSQPPLSGGSWCPDVAANGAQDPNPDDYKRVSVTVSPAAGRTTPTVQQTVLVYARSTHGPAVSCLSTTSTCPGANLSATGSSLTFNVTATTPPATLEWLVNGSLPPAAQVPVGAVDPYSPSGTTSSFTWTFPTTVFNGTTYTIDGTYTMSAIAFDADGNSGTRSSQQITINEHQAIPPATIHAGWNAQIHGVDIQWVPSVDKDIRYYKLYHQYGTNAAAPVTGCTQVQGLTCFDLDSNSAISPGGEPGTCTYSGTPNTPGVYQSFGLPNLYWVVGFDTDPITGQPRESTWTSQKIDANRCDHPPSNPTGLNPSGGSGSVTLNWTTPSAPADPDPGDGVQQWRIYRWPTNQTVNFPGSRLDLIGVLDASHNPVTSYTDRSADPNGTAQNYCITAVDTDLNESTCSNVVSG